MARRHRMAHDALRPRLLARRLSCVRTACPAQASHRGSSQYPALNMTSTVFVLRTEICDFTTALELLGSGIEIECSVTPFIEERPSNHAPLGYTSLKVAACWDGTPGQTVAGWGRQRRRRSETPLRRWPQRWTRRVSFSPEPHELW